MVAVIKYLIWLVIGVYTRGWSWMSNLITRKSQWLSSCFRKQIKTITNDMLTSQSLMPKDKLGTSTSLSYRCCSSLWKFKIDVLFVERLCIIHTPKGSMMYTVPLVEVKHWFWYANDVSGYNRFLERIFKSWQIILTVGKPLRACGREGPKKDDVEYVRSPTLYLLRSSIKTWRTSISEKATLFSIA